MNAQIAARFGRLAPAGNTQPYNADDPVVKPTPYTMVDAGYDEGTYRLRSCIACGCNPQERAVTKTFQKGMKL